jgi:hypothetical protein
MYYQIRIADILDALVEAVDAARVQTTDASWQRAINDAYNYLLLRDTVCYEPETHTLVVASATEPGKEYWANGECQCPCYERGNAKCWHRAAARLVRRAVERSGRTPPTPAATWANDAAYAAYGADLEGRQQALAHRIATARIERQRAA